MTTCRRCGQTIVGTGQESTGLEFLEKVRDAPKGDAEKGPLCQRCREEACWLGAAVLDMFDDELF